MWRLTQHYSGNPMVSIYPFFVLALHVSLEHHYSWALCYCCFVYAYHHQRETVQTLQLSPSLILALLSFTKHHLRYETSSYGQHLLFSGYVLLSRYI